MYVQRLNWKAYRNVQNLNLKWNLFSGKGIRKCSSRPKKRVVLNWSWKQKAVDGNAGFGSRAGRLMHLQDWVGRFEKFEKLDRSATTDCNLNQLQQSRLGSRSSCGFYSKWDIEEVSNIGPIRPVTIDTWSWHCTDWGSSFKSTNLGFNLIWSKY